MDYTPTKTYKQKHDKHQDFRFGAHNNNSKQIAASFHPPSLKWINSTSSPDLPDSPSPPELTRPFFPAPTKRWIHHNNQLTTHHFRQNGIPKNRFSAEPRFQMNLAVRHGAYETFG